MNQFVCLLRGINVSGKNLIKMLSLRTALSELGLSDVHSYLQSGNLVFTSDRNKKDLQIQIKELISQKFKLAVPVLIIADQDFMSRRASLNEFIEKIDKVHTTYFHATFLEMPSTETTNDWPKGKNEALLKVNDCVFLYCPNGYGKTKLNNNFIERRLGSLSVD